MKALERNKQTIYYANYTGRSVITDADGLYTGQTRPSYTNPTEAKVNLSASRGEASIDLFGTDVNYTNTIVSDKDLGLDENSILWVNKSPTTSSTSSVITPYNYIVVSVAKSLNSVVYAIRKVDVS